MPIRQDSGRTRKRSFDAILGSRSELPFFWDVIFKLLDQHGVLYYRYTARKSGRP